MNKRKKQKIEKFLEELNLLAEKYSLWFENAIICSDESSECEIYYNHIKEKYIIIKEEE